MKRVADKQLSRDDDNEEDNGEVSTPAFYKLGAMLNWGGRKSARVSRRQTRAFLPDGRMSASAILCGRGV